MRLIAALALSLALAGPALAQSVPVSPTDTTQSVLAAQKGKRITIRLRSGMEISGVVRESTGNLVVIEALAGREYYDAIVALESIEAVLVRNRP